MAALTHPPPNLPVRCSALSRRHHSLSGFYDKWHAGHSKEHLGTPSIFRKRNQQYAIPHTDIYNHRCRASSHAGFNLSILAETEMHFLHTYTRSYTRRFTML